MVRPATCMSLSATEVPGVGSTMSRLLTTSPAGNAAAPVAPATGLNVLVAPPPPALHAIVVPARKRFPYGDPHAWDERCRWWVALTRTRHLVRVLVSDGASPSPAAGSGPEPGSLGRSAPSALVSGFST